MAWTWTWRMTAVATILLIASPAHADWIDDCVRQWQGRTVSISGTISLTMDISATAKHPTEWEMDPGMDDAVLGGHCQITEVWLEGTRPASCVKGSQFAATGTVSGEAALMIPPLAMDASSISCR
jgi:hypothetical protein